MATKSRFRKLKRLLLVLFMLVLVFVGYVEIINQNSSGMSYRQKVLKAVYPAWMWLSKIRGKNTARQNDVKKQPPASFFSLTATLNNGSQLDFNSLKGKKVLLVNTASDCGFTNQYEDLQKLYEKYNGKLMIIGFPANDFKQQEKGTDEEIEAFCKKNFGVSFPLVKKSVVISSNDQHPVFKWLTDSTKNGWNNKPPAWNFTKYVVNEEGLLVNYFGPSVSPLSKEVQTALGE